MVDKKKLGLGGLLLMLGLGGMNNCAGFQEAHNNAKFKQQFVGGTTGRTTTYLKQFNERARHDPIGSYGPPMLTALGGYMGVNAFSKKKKEE